MHTHLISNVIAPARFMRSNHLYIYPVKKKSSRIRVVYLVSKSDLLKSNPGNIKIVGQIIIKMTTITLENLKQAINELLVEILQPIQSSFDEIQSSIDDLKASHDRSEALRLNSLLAGTDKLSVIPNVAGFKPDATIAYPSCLNCLLVSGDNLLPGTDEKNIWNKTKSKKLLAFYGMFDDENEDSDTEDENTVSSRRLRIKLARVLGVSHAQIQQASRHLND